jgi:hypothetical protein
MSRIWLLSVLLIMVMVMELRAQEKLTKQKFGDGISMKVPQSFIPMNEKDMWQRVTSYRKSIALFTDMNRVVELGINRSFSVWREGDYEFMFEVYKSSILELFDEVDFIQEDIVLIRKQPFVVFEFVSKMYPDESLGNGAINKYIYVQYTIFKGQTLVFDFSCPLFQKDQWQSVASQMMNSIKLK